VFVSEGPQDGQHANGPIRVRSRKHRPEMIADRLDMAAAQIPKQPRAGVLAQLVEYQAVAAAGFIGPAAVIVG
jgi:hypothetical protein